MSGYPRIEFTVASEGLARDVQHALTRFGIIAKLWRKKARAWRVEVTEPGSIATYQRCIGWIGEKARRFVAGNDTPRRSNVGHAPVETWKLVRSAATGQGMSLAAMAVRAGETASWHGFNAHTGRNIPKARLARYAEVLADAELRRIANDDLYWDEIIAIEDVGEQQVYDLTVPDGANFVAQDILVHNTAMAMSIARNAAVDYKKAVAFFSLEMSSVQLVLRLISAEAKVDQQRLRTGDLKHEHWQQIVSTIHRLTEAPMYIDDTPALGIMELRSRARLMKREHNIEMIVVDYLQLMHAPKAESREREISMISRGLKQLAKELQIPIIALAQLNRSVESRGDKRPMLSDLRESGCLTADTLVTLADGGRRASIGQLAAEYPHGGFRIWALNPATLKLEATQVSRAFSTGVKQVFRLTTRLGRTIRATGNHKFLTIDGWKRLDSLLPGEHVALPRRITQPAEATLSLDEAALLGHLIGDGCTLPRHTIQYTTRENDLATLVAGLAQRIFGEAVAPRIVHERPTTRQSRWYQVYLTSTRRHTHGVRSAVAEWLERLGIWGLRSHEKRVPSEIFAQPESHVACFLRHLWATDGCIRMRSGGGSYPGVYYASSSELLVRDVQSLLLRLGINARIVRVPQNGKGRDQHHIVVSGRPDLLRFAEIIGAVGCYKSESLASVVAHFDERTTNPNRDVIPGSVWKDLVVPAMTQSGMTTRRMQADLGMRYCGSSLYKRNLSRERAARVAGVVGSLALARLAQSDVYWDEVATLASDGVEEVFDLTVPGPHNFVADDIIVHNSIEQDADVVMFVHRPEYYGILQDEDGMPTEGTAEVIIGKQRNGPTGIAKLAFIKEFTRFENLAFQYDNPPQYLPGPGDAPAPF
jgi:replicative DNA helicase